MSRSLDDWISSYMIYVEDTESPRLYHLWGAISMIASALERKVFLIWDNITYCNMYIVIVGPSGLRKSGPFQEGWRFLNKLPEIRVAADCLSQRKLIDTLDNSFKSTPLTGGGTCNHSSLTVFSSEFAVFLGYDKKDLITFLTDWYDCKDLWKYGTQHFGSHEIKNVWLNIFGATTPDILQQTLITHAVGSGLTSRIIFVFDDKRYKKVLYPFVLKDQDLHKKLTDDLSRVFIMNGQFGYDEEFLALWGPWYDHSEDHPPAGLGARNFSGYINRRPKHVIKLAMVLSASRSDEMIVRGYDFKRAIEILEFTEKRMSMAFGGVGLSPMSGVMHSIQMWILEKDEVMLSDVQREFQADLEPGVIWKVINSLRIARVIDFDMAAGEDGDMLIKARRN